MRLDNAAKIFPPNSTPRDTKVFRFSCDLHEEVDEAALTQALELSLEEFPLFRSVLKRGMFWNYLEHSSLPARAEPDDLPACYPLYEKFKRNLLFRVTYFERRINFEVYHALTDGTGASRFLCALIYHYLMLRHPGDLQGTLRPDYDASPTQQREDSFQKYYDPKHKNKRKQSRAFQIKGARQPEWRLAVFEGVMPVAQVLERARAHGASLTAYLTAQMMLAISADMPLRQRDRPVVITVPVNLRSYYASQTARNFFATMEVGWDFRRGSEPDAVIAAVKREFGEELTPDKMADRMNQMVSLEYNVLARSAPLPLKDFVLRIAGNQAKGGNTASMSNLGVVRMPEPLRPYIDRIAIICSTDKLMACLSTYADTLTIGLTSAFVSAEIPRRFFRQLAGDGIDVGILNNPIGRNYEDL